MPTELTCPICSADLPIAGDESDGDQVYCSACGSPCKISGSGDDPNAKAVEDL